MDYASFLADRLRFITYFYDQSIQPFKEIMRKIDAQEEPDEMPAYYEEEEPPYLTEYLEAHEAASLLGVTCLTIVVGCFHTFLAHFIKGNFVRAKLPKVEGGWFERYRALFHDSPFCWDNSGADINLLSEAVFLRNDDNHFREIYSSYLRQSKDYKKAFTKSGFLDGSAMGHLGIMTVTREKLISIIEEANKLAEFL